MPRTARLDAPGALHHVMARGIEGRAIFLINRDREDFLRRMAGLVNEGAWVVYAWSLIPNHFHLLVRTAALPLSRSMRRLLTGYAVAFNRRHRRSGHLFQNRYKSIVVEEEPYFLELVRYLHLNPLRAGVVKDLKGLDRYPYSGHSALLGNVPRVWQQTGEVLLRYSSKTRQAVRQYREFVALGIKKGQRSELMGGGLVRSAGGWEAVRSLRRGREAFVSDERVLGSGAFVERLLQEVEASAEDRQQHGRSRVSLQLLAARISKDLGVSTEAILSGSRNRSVCRARAVLAYVWLEHLGRSGHDLALRLGLANVSVYLAAKRGKEAEALWKPNITGWCQ